jgi:cytochrome P450
MFRVALRDTSVGGAPVSKGDTVMILYGSANRDERYFEDPESFDLHRSTKQAHLSFGHGVHFCPGAPLARLEGRVTMSEALRRMRDIRLADGQSAIPLLPAIIQRIPVRLRVEFEKIE